MYPFTVAMLSCTATKYPNPATVNGYLIAVIDNSFAVYGHIVVNYRWKYQFTAAVNNNLTTVNGYLDAVIGYFLAVNVYFFAVNTYLKAGYGYLTGNILIICHFLQVAEHKTAAQGPANLGLTPQLYRYLKNYTDILRLEPNYVPADTKSIFIKWPGKDGVAIPMSSSHVNKSLNSIWSQGPIRKPIFRLQDSEKRQQQLWGASYRNQEKFWRDTCHIQQQLRVTFFFG